MQIAPFSGPSRDESAQTLPDSPISKKLNSAQPEGYTATGRRCIEYHSSD